MTTIAFDGQQLELNPGQTVLSALLDRGYDIPNSCQAGACQTCMMQVVEGELPDKSQLGLKDTLKAQGYFLACSCEPETPLAIVTSKSADLRSTVSVIGHETLGNNVLCLRIKPTEAFEYYSGQYLTVWKSETVGRSYSIASVAALNDYLELHIRRVENGVVSNWLHDEVKLGDDLQIQSATGDCFYIPGTPEQNILLAGTGTGLAPLFGIASDALHQGHSGNIHLVHGALKSKDLYMHQTLIDMAAQYSNFYYYASVLELGQNEQVSPPVTNESFATTVMNVAADPADWKVYLCGGPDIVGQLKKAIFLAGASIKNIYSDPFISAHSNDD